MKALDVVRNAKFKNGHVLTAAQLNKLVYAIRALERKVKKK